MVVNIDARKIFEHHFKALWTCSCRRTLGLLSLTIVVGYNLVSRPFVR
jgi:hypothetical protein